MTGVALAGALEMALLGRDVLPLWGVVVSNNGVPNQCECPSGAECPDPGKHPRLKGNWQTHATRDYGTIERWGRRYPLTNFGYAMDGDPPLVGLDVDPRNGGALDGLPRTSLMIRTGGGGFHVVGTRPNGTRFANELRPGIEVKAGGRYLVAPGSLHVSGNRYAFYVHPGDGPLLGFPTDLFQPTTPPKDAGSREPWIELALGGVSKGERNDTAARLAGYYLSKGVGVGITIATLRPFAAACDPPLPEAELRKVVESVDRKERSKPSGVVSTVRMVSGGTFALDGQETLISVWGRPDETAWARGEPMLIVGPTGVGHTTLLQRLIRALVGLDESTVLGLPVAVTDKPVLYLAADRPKQARRSFRRMASESERAMLDERVLVHEGPPGFDVAKHPERLVEMAVSLGVGTVCLDAYKDVAARLSEDETGSGFTRLYGLLMGEGIELVGTHHQRKGTNDNRKPNSIDDVYGSAWITASAGTVLLLWGKAGDPIVELSQLKQAAGEVGPLNVLVDFQRGALSVADDRDPLQALTAAGTRGISAADLAKVLYGSTKPSAAETEKARRQLQRLVDRGLASRDDPAESHADQLRGKATRYYPSGQGRLT